MSTPITTKVTASVVISANDRMEIWQPGYLIVRDGVIDATGPGPGPEGDFTEALEFPDKIVTPGLVNGHAHSPSNLAEGHVGAVATGDLAPAHPRWLA